MDFTKENIFLAILKFLMTELDAQQNFLHAYQIRKKKIRISLFRNKKRSDLIISINI